MGYGLLYVPFQTMSMECRGFKFNQMVMVLQLEVFWRDTLMASCSLPLFLCLGLRQPAISHLPVWLEGKPGQKRLWRRVWEPGQQHPGPTEPASQQQGLQLYGLRRHSDDTTGDRCEPAARSVPLRWDTLVENEAGQTEGRCQGRVMARHESHSTKPSTRSWWMDRIHILVIFKIVVKCMSHKIYHF